VRRIAKPAELLRVFSSFVDDPSRRARLLLRILAWRSPNVSLLHLCHDIELIKAFNQAGLPRPSVEHMADIFTRSMKVDLAYPQRRIAIRFETQRLVDSQRFLAIHQDQHMLLEDAGWCCVHADLETDLLAFTQHIGELLRSRPPIATPEPAS
jgi:hypothetical protein